MSFFALELDSHGLNLLILWAKQNLSFFKLLVAGILFQQWENWLKQGEIDKRIVQKMQNMTKLQACFQNSFKRKWKMSTSSQNDILLHFGMLQQNIIDWEAY